MHADSYRKNNFLKLCFSLRVSAHLMYKVGAYKRTFCTINWNYILTAFRVDFSDEWREIQLRNLNMRGEKIRCAEKIV